MKKRHETTVAIPGVAFEHIRIECGKVSRRFHLNDDERAELECHIRCEALLAVDDKYDFTKGTVYTFIQRVVRNQICVWMKEETRRRNDWRDHVEAEAKRQAKREASGAPSNSVDDTTYSDEERWGHGEELPVARLGEDAAWDGEGLARLMVMADVRQVVGSLKGDSKRLCKWYLKTGSLRKAAEKMHEDSKYFFQVLWPRCKVDFIAQWEELGKHFAGQK